MVRQLINSAHMDFTFREFAGSCFPYVIIIGAFTLIIGLMKRVLLRDKLHIVFPSEDSIHVVFREDETWARSGKNFWTRFRNSGNSTVVVVTDNEIWVQPSPMIRLFAGKFDLEHRIRICDVTSVRKIDSILRELVEIRFKNREGSEVVIVLSCKDNNALIDAIGWKP